MNSWHSARTGRLPTPSALQAQSIAAGAAKVQEQQMQLALLHAGTEMQPHAPNTPSLAQQMARIGTPGAGHSSSGGNQSLSSTLHAPLLNSGSNLVGSGGVVDTDWSSIPWSLTQSLHSLLSNDSESRKNIQVLKHACEELKREQKNFITIPAANQMTVGTQALQKELHLVKEVHAKYKSTTDARIHSLESQLSKLSEEFFLMSKKQSSHESSVASSFDQVNSHISYTQNDIQERGLIMSKLSDRLMDEIELQRIACMEVRGEMKELQRRVFAFEYTTQVAIKMGQHATAAGGGGASTHAIALALATGKDPNLAASATGTPASAAPVSKSSQNPLSASSSLAARKRSEHFVTHDAVQLNPPGSAVFLAAAQAAIGAAEQANLHPLAPVIEQHAKEKAAEELGELTAGSAEQQDGARKEGEQPRQQQQQQQQQTLALPPATPQQQQQQSPPSHAIQPYSPAPHVSFPPSSPSRTAPPAPPAGASPDSSQFQRYMQDYTTRNLQRDLLEIAETYQSTIRNEVDGLRTQLLSVRRQHSEDLAKHSATLASFNLNASTLAAEQKRAISTLDHFVRNKITELLERMRLVEVRTAAVESSSVARSAQIELKYSQRNEEIREALNDMHQRLDQHFGGKLTAHSGNSNGGGNNNAAVASSSLERDLLTLHVNLEQSLKLQSEKNACLSGDVTQLRHQIEENKRGLNKQILSVHNQMKSLFADAFASLDGASGGGGRGASNLAHSLLPCLTPSNPGAYGASNLTSEKKRFIMSPHQMGKVKRNTERMGNSNVIQFATDAAYKTTTSAGQEGEQQDWGSSSGQDGAEQQPYQQHPSNEGYTPRSRPRSQQDSVRMRGARGLSPDAADDEEKNAATTSGSFGHHGQVRLRQTAVSSLSRGHGASAATTPGAEIKQWNAGQQTPPPTAPAGASGGIASPRQQQSAGRLRVASGQSSSRRTTADSAAHGGASSSRSPPRVVEHASSYRAPQIEHVLSVGKRDLSSRPTTTPHQRAVAKANANQDAYVATAVMTEVKQRPRTSGEQQPASSSSGTGSKRDSKEGKGDTMQHPPSATDEWTAQSSESSSLTASPRGILRHVAATPTSASLTSSLDQQGRAQADSAS